MHFIWDRIEEIKTKILEFYADKMHGPLHVMITNVLLSYLFGFDIVVIYGYRGVNIFLSGANVCSRVNLVHFEGLHLDS